MKRILQAMDGVASKPAVGASEMSKFLRIIDEDPYQRSGEYVDLDDPKYKNAVDARGGQVQGGSGEWGMQQMYHGFGYCTQDGTMRAQELARAMKIDWNKIGQELDGYDKNHVKKGSRFIRYATLNTIPTEFLVNGEWIPIPKNLYTGAEREVLAMGGSPELDRIGMDDPGVGCEDDAPLGKAHPLRGNRYVKPGTKLFSKDQNGQPNQSASPTGTTAPADPKIIQLQKELISAGERGKLGPFGPNHDGVDGVMGKYTKNAINRHPDIAKKYFPTSTDESINKFLSIIDKNDVEILKEEVNNNTVLNEGANPHKVSLPVQMAMQHYQAPKEIVISKPTVLKSYFKEVEDQHLEAVTEKKQLMRQYASHIAERVLMKESASSKKQDVAEVKQRLDAKCWTGKHKEGTKIKGGVRVNNCVPNESVISEKSTTEKQARTMAAAAHNPEFAKKLGIKSSVAKEFNKADTGTKKLSNAMKHKKKKVKEDQNSDHRMGFDPMGATPGVMDAKDATPSGGHLNLEDAQSKLHPTKRYRMMRRLSKKGGYDLSHLELASDEELHHLYAQHGLKEIRK